MVDLALAWSGDLCLSPSQDLALVSEPQRTEQRIIRRLLTAPGAYFWNAGYGAGVGAAVGVPARPSAIEAVIRAQISLESSVAANPVPQVSTLFTTPDVMTVNIVYADAATQGSATFVFSVST